eukprot:INCI15072.5.p1 GENE.INCI15072.5~~INCI15072.5.p1  ORF type:complete len:472 (-),score=73.07 INCI15072.5:268-1683(-)
MLVVVFVGLVAGDCLKFTLTPAAAPLSTSSSSKPVVLKMLVNNNDAGHIIGKRGATVNELQQTTGCEIKLSQHTMLFPGTNMRVVLLRGTMAQVTTATSSVLSLCAEAEIQAGQTEEQTTTILIPLQFSGSLIGQKGETIDKMQVECGARIQLAKKDTVVQGVNERQVTISAPLHNRMQAITTILHQMQAEEGDAGIYQNQSTQYTFSGARGAGGFGRDPYRPHAGPTAAFGGDGAQTMLEISVPDSYIGGVVGRGGAVITNIQNTSGARVQISQKGVYFPGTTRRIIKITGSQAQCDAAQAMITNIVDEQTMRNSGGGYGGGGSVPPGRGGGYDGYDGGSAYAPSTHQAPPGPSRYGSEPYAGGYASESRPRDYYGRSSSAAHQQQHYGGYDSSAPPGPPVSSRYGGAPPPSSYDPHARAPYGASRSSAGGSAYGAPQHGYHPQQHQHGHHQGRQQHAGSYQQPHSGWGR